MSYGHRTLSMVAGTGYVVPLAGPDGSTPNVVVLLPRAECWFQTANQGVAPVAPTVSPVPASGATASWEHCLAGEQHTTGTDPAASPSANKSERISHIVVWAIATGNLVIVTS